MCGRLLMVAYMFAFVTNVLAYVSYVLACAACVLACVLYVFACVLYVLACVLYVFACAACVVACVLHVPSWLKSHGVGVLRHLPVPSASTYSNTHHSDLSLIRPPMTHTHPPLPLFHTWHTHAHTQEKRTWSMSLN